MYWCLRGSFLRFYQKIIFLVKCEWLWVWARCNRGENATGRLRVAGGFQGYAGSDTHCWAGTGRQPGNPVVAATDPANHRF